MPVRVLICIRFCLYAKGLRRLLEEDEEIQVAGIVRDERDLEDLEKLDLDLILSDAASFPQVAGRGWKILLLWDVPQVLPQVSELKEMVALGLAGILTAGTGSALLWKAVKKIDAGELWFDNNVIKTLCMIRGSGREMPLSRREAEVLRYICEGLSNKAIAGKLDISEQTVKTHCNHLFRKFGVSSRLKLAMWVTSYR